MRRTVRILVAVVLLLLLAAGGIVTYLLRVTGDQGSSALERWIGVQLQGVVASHLNATLNFENPDYQYPLTVVVDNVRLTAPDPAAGEGKTLDIIEIDRATLTLAEIPAEGQPLRIERVVLERPRLRFTCRSADDISLVGFSDLVKTDESAPAPPPSPGAEAAPPVKVTDVFQIRMVHITNGEVHYDPRRSDRRAMMLDRINMAMNVQPDTEGWYAINTKIDRLPLGELDINGRYNLNDNAIDLAKLAMKVDLAAEGGKSLPPQMQQFLAEHDVRGELAVSAKGTIALGDWRNAKLDASVNLSEARFSFGEYRLSVPQMAVLASMSDRAARIDRLDARFLGGSLFGAAQLKFNDALDSHVRLEADELRIHQLLRAAPEDDAAGTSSAAQELPLRGTLKLTLDASAPLSAVMTKLGGTGYVRLTEGRLVQLPGISMIEDAIAGGIGSKKGAARDDALVLFTLRGDRVRLDRLDYRSTVLAIRGGGNVMLDGLELDLIVNGGPIEKVQSLLGPVGDFTALLTDRIAKYHVTGRIGAPQVKTVIAEGVFDRIFGR